MRGREHAHRLKLIFIQHQKLWVAHAVALREIEGVQQVNAGDGAMGHLKRYLVERDIPGIGGMSIVELCGAARASNQAIAKLGSAIQWQHSYVAGDRAYCIYLAEDEDTIRAHAQMSGIPVSNITEVPQIIDPTTANN
ncbi:MAG TPA: DUF4242 domain-containing protein [Allosphingosinicella sp.]